MKNPNLNYLNNYLSKTIHRVNLGLQVLKIDKLIFSLHITKKLELNR